MKNWARAAIAVHRADSDYDAARKLLEEMPRGRAWERAVAKYSMRTANRKEIAGTRRLVDAMAEGEYWCYGAGEVIDDLLEADDIRQAASLTERLVDAERHLPYLSLVEGELFFEYTPAIERAEFVALAWAKTDLPAAKAWVEGLRATEDSKGKLVRKLERPQGEKIKIDRY